jgi:hypothetical protein
MAGAFLSRTRKASASGAGIHSSISSARGQSKNVKGAALKYHGNYLLRATQGNEQEGRRLVEKRNVHDVN